MSSEKESERRKRIFCQRNQEPHLLAEHAHLLLCELISSLDKLDSHPVDAVHQPLVHHTIVAFAQPASPALQIPADGDVVSVEKRQLPLL